MNNEAFERAKSAYGTGAYDDATMEFLFPQLRESEDERIRKFLIQHISEWIGCIEHDLKISSKDIESEKELVMFKAGLAYLEKQKEQKPAEWSEEDEDMLNSCISSIEESKENRYAYKETDGDTSYDHEIAWLKSLRNRVGKEFLQPHWKPTEEQMKALWDASERNDKLGSVLRNLYNDLKKL